ncbi:MAG: hypothetical protein ACE5GB_08170 [Acidimicrobiales bacterium]
MDGGARIELTFRMWSRGSATPFEEYVAHVVDELLPRHGGVLERRAAEVDAGPARPDAVLVLSFPDSPSVDGFLRDPLREDREDLARQALARVLITDSRHHRRPDGPPADVVTLPGADDDLPR